jgi:glycogen debranching enzyme
MTGWNHLANKMLEGLIAQPESHPKTYYAIFLSSAEKSEIFDGDAAHAPRGCVAQAWSVAELLRAIVEDVD